MQDILTLIREEVSAALREVAKKFNKTPIDEAVIAKAEVSQTKDLQHGELASNAAMVAAKALQLRPVILAGELAAFLSEHSSAIAKAEPAGPGFVNLTLKPAVWQNNVKKILEEGATYGASALGQGRKVNVEYVSANPTGPMHIGHCRGAVVGDAIASLLQKTGFAVTREYYINDAGAQVIALAYAAYFRYLQALGSEITAEDFAKIAPTGLQYQGEYLIEVGEALKEKFGNTLASAELSPADSAVWLETVRSFTVAAMMKAVRQDLLLLGVRHDVFSSERALAESGAVERVLADFKARDLIYEGVLEPPKGKLPDDWEPRAQTLFRATAFGDEIDRPLRKSDGSNTYFANDIAYHEDKLRRGADFLIDIWGADHAGYVPRMKAAVAALASEKSDVDKNSLPGVPGLTGKKPVSLLEVVLCQIVRVVRNGEPVKMSKRAGSYITLRDLIDEVGPDVVRFIILTRKSDAQMDFDIDKALAETRDNPVFYVQYAHARCCSVLRSAVQNFNKEAEETDFLKTADLSLLASPEELNLIRLMSFFPDLIKGAALAREPHRLTFFLYDLASAFHALWAEGRKDANMRFLTEDRPDLTGARLALLKALKIVLAEGLHLLGVKAAEELR